MKLEFFAETARDKRMDNLVIPFIEGARAMGISAAIRAKGIPSHDCDIAVIFGYQSPYAKPAGLRDRIIAAQSDGGGIVIGIDIGAFMSWQLENFGGPVSFRIALGSPTGAGTYFNDHSPPDRWIKAKDLLRIQIKDWRKSGSAILFCGQADRGWQYNNPTPFHLWFEKQIGDLRQFTDRPIVFRPHPAAKEHDHRWLARFGIQVSDEQLGRNLYKVLADEWAMITHSSSAAVDAVISGIPTFCASETCVAWEVCNSDYSLIESPKLFDREQWLYNSAYTSWYTEEIREGIPLRRILDHIGW